MFLFLWTHPAHHLGASFINDWQRMKKSSIFTNLASHSLSSCHKFLTFHWFNLNAFALHQETEEHQTQAGHPQGIKSKDPDYCNDECQVEGNVTGFSVVQSLLDSRSLKFIVSLTLHDRTTKSLLHLHKKKKPPSISAQFQVRSAVSHRNSTTASELGTSLFLFSTDFFDQTTGDS